MARVARILAVLGAVVLGAWGVAAARIPAPPTVPTVLHAPTRTVVLPWGRMGYRVIGHGSPLVLIMGLEGTMDAWPPSFIASLARAHRVIVFDNEGIGRSTLRPGPLSIPRMADDTAALIAALHLGRPDVLGWSMGGFIAQALAVRHPGRVHRLILSASAPGNGHAVLPSKKVTDTLSANPVGALAFLFPPDRSKFAAAYTKAITAYPHFYITTTAVAQLQLVASAAWLTGQDAAGPRVGALRVPTLVGDGADDVILPTANSIKLAHLIHGARLTLYPDAGHGFLFQDQRAWVARIERFLK